jgi:hypothetical protein
MKRLVFLSAGIAFSTLFVAEAQEPKVRISPKATYNDAVLCYQYYTIATELARKLESAQNTSADQAAGFELQAILAKRVLVGWSKHLGMAAGKRTKGQLDADIKKIGAPVVADANAALNGDKAAAKRGADRGKACSSLEVVEAAGRSNG